MSATAIPKNTRIGPFNRVLIFLTALFLLARLFYFIMGIRFDETILHANMQLLDLELLKTNLLESLFYLHIQPPLFNLFTAIILKLFPEHTALAFHTLFFIIGLILYLALFLLQIQLGIAKSVAILTSTIFLLSPSYILYENMFFYTFPVAAILTVSMLCLHKMLNSDKIETALYFFISLFLLCGIRSTYHLLYYVLISITIIILCSLNRKIIILAAVVPFILLLSIYLKNYFLFGKFTTASWMGMNLSAQMYFPNANKLIAEGKISEICLVPRFAKLERYPEKYRTVKNVKNIPALCSQYKSDGGVNYNHLAYIDISNDYFKNAIYFFRNFPKYNFVRLSVAWSIYFSPSSDIFPKSSGNLNKILFIDSIYSNLVGARFPPLRPKGLGIYYIFNPFFLFGLPLMLAHGLGLALIPKSIIGSLTRNQRITILYICFNIIYGAIIGNTFEIGENNRFRFETDPLYIALLGLFIHYYVIPRFKATTLFLSSGVKTFAGVLTFKHRWK